MNVRYTRRAERDLAAIIDYIHERSPRGAERVGSLVVRRIAGLADQPYKGIRTNKGDIYTMWIAPRPYRVYYRVDREEEVVIIHIRHTSRRPWAIHD